MTTFSPSMQRQLGRRYEGRVVHPVTGREDVVCVRAHSFEEARAVLGAFGTVRSVLLRFYRRG